MSVATSFGRFVIHLAYAHSIRSGGASGTFEDVQAFSMISSFDLVPTCHLEERPGVDV